MTRQRTGLMVLRMWIEEGSTEPLRVDVRETFDLRRGEHSTMTVTDVDAVLAAVRNFLESTHGVDDADGDGAT